MDEDNDQDKFAYQLLAISSLARLMPNYSLPLLTRYVEYFYVVTVFLQFSSRSSVNLKEQL